MLVCGVQAGLLCRAVDQAPPAAGRPPPPCLESYRLIGCGVCLGMGLNFNIVTAPPLSPLLSNPLLMPLLPLPLPSHPVPPLPTPLPSLSSPFIPRPLLSYPLLLPSPPSSPLLRYTPTSIFSPHSPLLQYIESYSRLMVEEMRPEA